MANNSTKHTARKNNLTDLIPGYTAPLNLTGREKEPALPSLQALHRQALASESRKLLGANTTKKNPLSKKTVRSFKTGKPIAKTKHKTAGERWFNMRSTPMTPALQQDLAMLRNRNYLDPKRFYKNPDSADASGVVQLGTIIAGPMESTASSSLVRKERRSHMTEEWLADAGSSEYALSKFRTMQQEKSAQRAKRKKKFSRRR